MNKLKITVIKKTLHQELIDNYLSDSYKNKGFGYCDKFTVGQEFTIDSLHLVPTDFCAWAWKDIQNELAILMHDGKVPWMKDQSTAIVCCTDGFRPVIFKIDKI